MAALRKGWAFGEFIGSREWLTILGSAYRRPEFYPTREAAGAAMDAHPASKSPHLTLEVAYVTETPRGGCSGGYAYRVAEPA